MSYFDREFERAKRGTLIWSRIWVAISLLVISAGVFGIFRCCEVIREEGLKNIASDVWEGER